MIFPCFDHLSFYGETVNKVIVFCFSDSFDQKTTQQLDGSGNVTIEPQFLENIFENSLFFLFEVSTHLKNRIWVKNTVLPGMITKCASNPVVEITLSH